MSIRRSLVVSAVTMAVVATVPALTTVSVQAAGTGSGIGYTLEGCRASATVYPINGPFICPDGDYTTGNLGGGWNEFDLVPGRVIVKGSGVPAGQVFTFDVTVDRCSNTSNPCTATPGYDRVSVPTLNAAKSSGTCGSAVVSAEGVFGDQLFRQVDVTGQGSNSSCVYDFYARLAIGSHGYPGSSLHYHLNNETHGTQGIGNKDVSIPVKQIAPFGFSKTETASQGSSVVWQISKTATSSLNFNDTCASTAGQSVTVQVSWTKTPTNGAITVDGAVSIGNSAHRPLNIHIADQLYDGLAGNTTDGAAKIKDYLPFPALTNDTYHDVWSPPDNVASGYHDVASGTVTDPVFLDQVSLTPATASASVVTNPPASGATAVITDVEALTDGSDPTNTTAATDYKFRVTNVSGASGTIKTAANATYTPGAAATLTTGPLTWTSVSQSASGSVTFTKQVVPNNATQETATLHDTATVTPDGQVATQSSASTAITAGATVSIEIDKTTSVALQNDSTFTFNAYGPGHGPNPPGDGVVAGTTTAKVVAGSTGPATGTITGLAPGTKYLIDEPAVAPFPAFSQADVEVDLPACSTQLPILNTAAPAQAQVRKITDPASGTVWSFTLTGPNGLSETLSNVTAGSGYQPFLSLLDVDGGTYTITEDAVLTNYDLSSVAGDIDGSAASTSVPNRTCSITLDLNTHSDGLFECTFTNTKRADVKVVKTQNGGTPTDPFTFRLCPGTSKTSCGTGSGPAGSADLTTNGTNLGTLDFGYEKPGSYVLCELAVPAGTHSSLQDQGGTLDVATGNVCVAFTLSAGVDKTFTVDNTSPKGNALTIGYWKHWNSINVGNSIKAGNKLMDTFLPQNLGPYVVNTAQKGVNVLSNPSMKFGENGLAAQLLAAELNVASGALTCAAITSAITQANTLLNGIGYAGPVGSTVGNKHPQRNAFVTTASTLDKYNNNQLC